MSAWAALGWSVVAFIVTVNAAIIGLGVAFAVRETRRLRSDRCCCRRRLSDDERMWDAELSEMQP
jgi:hypothetical protein